MKRYIIIVVLALFVYSLVFVAPSINAQDTVIETETPIGVEMTASESSITTEQRINYELPYPGMLPDHPLYFLKAIRDSIVKFLINDDLKRAKFSLLNAEKRMFAGKMLIEKNRDEKGIDTLSKSNNYLTDTHLAVVRYKKSHPKSTDIRPFLHKFDTAILKHQEITNDLKPLVDKKYLPQFLAEEKRMIQTEQTVKILLNQK